MKKAFSLAEVLLTLSIIGVIAAMTIPGLQISAQQRELVAACKKEFSTFSNALALAEQMNGPARKWGLTNNGTAKEFEEYLAPYLNVSRMCSNEKGCFGEGPYYKLDKSEYSDLSPTGFGSPKFAFQLASGVNVAYDVYPEYTSSSLYGVDNIEQPVLYFFVDVNGNKAPNTLGKDIFIFVRNKDGLKPAGADRELSNIDCGKDKTGTECAAMVIKYSDMDYDKHIQEAKAGTDSAEGAGGEK